MNTININQLPQDVQSKVRETLTAYNTTYVEFENGRYTHIAGLCLDTRKKAADFKTFEIKNSDVYNETERASNLKALSNSFAKMNVSDSFWN